jgi:cytochrome b6-f complex iron-sulfur subunit
MSKITRKEFMKLVSRILVVTGVAAVFGPIIAYFFPANLEETPSEPVPAGPLDDLPVGESKMVRFGRYPALLINTPQGLKAYSAVCTHFACLVKWDPGEGEIMCPCHDAGFDVYTGEVLHGPPPRGLDVIAVEIVDGEIYVGGAG